MEMSRAVWCFIAVLGLASPALSGSPADNLIRIPLGEAGELTLGRLLDLAGVDAKGAPEPRKDAGLTLPLEGMAGALTRSLLRETLGAEVRLERDGRMLVIGLPEGENLRERLDGLALRIREAEDRSERYGLHARSSYRPNDPDRPTVCLVHGINSSSYSFVHMVKPLEEAGFGVVVYDFPYNIDLDKQCEQFVENWLAFRAKTGDRRPWAVLTHSMGALLARWYVEGDRYANDVSRLILVGPPNRGAAMARAQGVLQFIEGLQGMDARQADAIATLSQGLGEAAEDLMLGSAFLDKLNALPRRDGVEYHIIAGSRGFLTKELRTQLESQLKTLRRKSALLGGLLSMALPDLSELLDELSEGTGDGVISLRSAELPGVTDVEVLPVNHVELIRGPLLYPDPGPVACLPVVLDRLRRDRPAP